jgi:hypothetical protein
LVKPGGNSWGRCLPYSAKDRANRAKELLDDPFVQELLLELEQRALNEFISAHRWWWGDRKRRLAAERLRVVKDFRYLIEMAIVMGPENRIRRANHG